MVTVFRTELACGQDRLTGTGVEPLPQLSGVPSLSPGTYKGKESRASVQQRAKPG